MPPRRPLFLDRDGVLNDPVPDAALGGPPESPYRPEDVRLLRGRGEARGTLRDAGFALVVVDQPARRGQGHGYAGGAAGGQRARRANCSPTRA